MDRKNKPYDTLVAAASDALKKAGFDVFPGLKVDYPGIQSGSDVDILAIRENLMLVIECKDTVHPVDPFELRTAYNAITKAADQLDYIKSAFADTDYFVKFSKNNRLDTSKINTIKPVILTSFRDFWGYAIGGTPVRSHHEFSSFLLHGIWDTSIPDLGAVAFRIWNSDLLQIKDVVQYLTPGESAHQVHLDAVETYYHTYGKMKFRKYAFNLSQLLTDLKARFPIVPSQFSNKQTNDGATAGSPNDSI
jgi:hypothetical protein